jgi:hypothetical protein
MGFGDKMDDTSEKGKRKARGTSEDLSEQAEQRGRAPQDSAGEATSGSRDQASRTRDSAEKTGKSTTDTGRRNANRARDTYDR